MSAKPTATVFKPTRACRTSGARKTGGAYPTAAAVGAAVTGGGVRALTRGEAVAEVPWTRAASDADCSAERLAGRRPAGLADGCAELGRPPPLKQQPMPPTGRNQRDAPSGWLGP